MDFGQYTPHEKESGLVAGDPECAVIIFPLEDIRDLELYQFSFQNGIADLWPDRAEHGFRLKVWPCYGIAGRLHAGKARIEFVTAPAVNSALFAPKAAPGIRS